MAAESKIDITIGKKLRQLRNIKGISQNALASDAGITFQQVQKYEKGINRISAARIFDFAKILGVDVTYFFKDLEPSDRKYSFSENDSSAFEKENLFETKETAILLREYYKIKTPAARKHILEIIKAMTVKQ